MPKNSEHLPRTAAELERLADYYDTHDTSADMEGGQWRAAEERMAASIDAFYAGATPPLPIGVLPDDEEERAGDEATDAGGPA